MGVPLSRVLLLEVLAARDSVGVAIRGDAARALPDTIALPDAVLVAAALFDTVDVAAALLLALMEPVALVELAALTLAVSVLGGVLE